MEVIIPKKIKIQIPSELLKFNQVEERLDVKPNTVKVTWTDQYGTERNIQKLTDGHAANLAIWFRERGLCRTEEIIQCELERRCTGSYPDKFNDLIQIYKSCQEIWRLKVY